MPDFGVIHAAQGFGKVMPMKLSASAVLLVAAGLVAFALWRFSHRDIPSH